MRGQGCQHRRIQRCDRHGHGVDLLRGQVDNGRNAQQALRALDAANTHLGTRHDASKEKAAPRRHRLWPLANSALKRLWAALAPATLQHKGTRARRKSSSS
eukprot:15455311-Alexandrium_andersonii.AAC.2